MSSVHRSSRRFEDLRHELEYIQSIPKYSSYHKISVNIDQGTNASNNEDEITTTRTNSTYQNHMNEPLPRILHKQLLKRTQTKHYRSVKNIKTAYSELYLMLVLLQNYQVLNVAGFRNILEIHDSLFETNSGEEWRKLHIDSTGLHTSKMVIQLIQNVETIYTDALESGDRTRTLKRLRVPPLGQKKSSTATFRIGLFVGMFCLLLPALFGFGIYFKESQSKQSLAWRVGLLLYRSPCLIVLEIILVGINMYGWSSSGVNHVLIFEIDPRHHLTYQQLLEVGTCFLVLWFLSFIGFIISFHLEFYPFVQPIAFAALMILFLINPMPIFYRQSRFWFLQKLAKVFAAPFYRVGFADFWLGEQLLSLELVFFDLEFFFCFYTSDHKWWSSNLTTPSSPRGTFCTGWTRILLQTCLIVLPSWFRFAQNLRRYHDTKHVMPHLINAGKSATGFFVAITNSLRRATAQTYFENPTSNPYLYIWIIASVIGATYKLLWDLKMDWGFFEKNSNENKYLRDHIVYSSKVYYYAAIIENIIFRYIWVINIFVHFHTQSAEYSDVIGFSFGLIEVFRRFIWNFFRLENEHLNNCDEFRAVRDISIVPISADIDFALINYKMSKEPGIRHRYRVMQNGPLSGEENVNTRSQVNAKANELENNNKLCNMNQLSMCDVKPLQKMNNLGKSWIMSVRFSSSYPSIRHDKMNQSVMYSSSMHTDSETTWSF